MGSAAGVSEMDAPTSGSLKKGCCVAAIICFLYWVYGSLIEQGTGREGSVAFISDTVCVRERVSMAIVHTFTLTQSDTTYK